MATVIIKNFKLPRLSNIRLKFTGVKSNFSDSKVYFSRSCRQIKNERNELLCKWYSTVATQHAFNEEPTTRRQANRQMLRIKDFSSIDKALEEIDWIIRGSGRILTQYVIDALSKVSAKQMPTSKHGLYLLRCCKYIYDEPPPARIDLVNKIWNRFQELGVKFEVKHYNALLEVHIYNDLAFNPAEFLASLGEQGLEPNQDTCLLLMKKYCKDGNIGGASEILEFMKEKGFAANEEVFNNIIHGHLKNKDFAGAKDMLEVMRSLNLNPTEDTYAEFACGYAAEGNKDQMMSYLCSEDNNLLMSSRNCLKVIKVLAVSGNNQYIDDVLGLIRNVSDYRQESINTAIELIHKGCVDVAYKLIIATAGPQFNQGTNIFIRQLIKSNQPASQVFDYCKDILNKGLNDIIFLNALRSSADSGNIDCAYLFLKDMISKGHPVRNSSFYPLFISLKKKKASEGVWNVLKAMSDLGVVTEFTTYLDYVYPCLGVPSLNDVIRNVKESGQFRETATDALFVYYCNLGKVDLAFDLMQTVSVNVSSRMDFKSFLNRYQNIEGDALNKYFQILKYILENVEAIGAETEGYQGKFLADLILTKPALFQAFLRKFEYENFAIREHAMIVCENILRQKNPASLGHLRRLKNRTSKMKDMTLEEEQQQLNHLIAEKKAKGFLVDRIIHYCKLKNVNRVSELVTIFENIDLNPTALMLAEMTSLHAYMGDLEKAMETFSKLKKEFPSFRLEIEKTLDLSSVLTKYGRCDDALHVLKEGITEPYIYGSRTTAVRAIRRVTTSACDTGDTKYAQNVQNLLMPLSKEFGLKKQFLEPLIIVHLNRNDLMSAFDEYTKCIMDYKIPAGLNSFLKKCITTGDKTYLEKVIDVTAKHLGKSTALIELAVAFIECGRSHKADAIIQNLGPDADSAALEDVCVRLSDQNRLTDLEQLIAITKGLIHIDRERLYHYLFKVCAARNDYEKVIDIFNRLRNDGIEPSAKTVDFVSNMLKQNNQPIPLSLLSSKPSEPGVPDEISIEATKTFLQYLQAGDVQLALKEASELKKGFIRTFSLQNLTDLLDLCLKNNCVDKLSSNVQLMSYIIEYPREVLKPLLEKYSESGDIEKFISIANVIPDFSLKVCGFNSYFCQAFISRGEHEKLLTYLEERCDSSNKMFSEVAFNELLKYPEYEDRVLNLAVKYYENKFVFPIAVIWAQFFIKGIHDKANELYKKFTFPVERVSNKILRAIRQNENLSLGQAYIDFVNDTITKPKVKERAFGTFLDILVLKQKYDDAVSLVLEAEKLELPLHKYYQSTLITLKNALERENKPIPFRIPSEEFLPDSSSSDSE